MSFMNTNSLDDYKNDIKPDQSTTPFNDSFSSIAWSPTLGPIFASTSWDGELRVYEVGQTQMGPAISQKLAYKFNSPALKCCWSSQTNHIYVGLMDGSIKAFDVNTSQLADIGKHNTAISSLNFIPGQNALISTGYDNIVNFWSPGNSSPVLNFNVQNKIFTSDFQFPLFICGTANEKIIIADINMLNNKTVTDSVDLGKFSQIQSIAINQKGSTFGIASFDGRANLSNITKNVNGQYTPVSSYKIQKSVITFKSNKQEEGGNTILYPINAVSFNPVNDKWFMTAGSDGGMHFWDFQAKNKIKTLNYGCQPICAAKVSPKGDMIAYALGNDWHIGQEGASKWPTKLGVHVITEQETKFHK